MKKALYIPLLGLFLVILPLLAGADTTGGTTASSLSVSPADANGNSTVSQSSSLTTPSGTYQFKSDGIFGCNQTGAAASSVGAFSAGGVYVPVADATVELNTGYLVYLFCSLRPLVSSLSENASARIVAQIEVAITTGNNGNPQFSVNSDAEDLKTATNKFNQVLNAGILSPLNTALQGPTQSALVQTFSSATQQPNSVLQCPYTGDLSALLSGTTVSWAGLQALENPACNPMGAYQLASNVVNGYVSGAVQNNVAQRTMGNGMYPLTTTDSFGNVNVVTPGSMVLAQANQALEAGLLKTINAQDIGQLVNGYFAGLGATAVTTAQGLVGINQPANSSASTLGQMLAAAAQDANNSIVNTTTNDLNGLASWANRIYNALYGQTQLYANTSLQLKQDEINCWNQIIQTTAICDANSFQYTSSGPTCTHTTPGVTTTTGGSTGGRSGSGTAGTTVTSPPTTITLHIATTTQFSDAVIATFATQAASISQNLGFAQADVQTVQTLGVSLQSTDQTVQSLAMQNIETLFVANHTKNPTHPIPSDTEANTQEANVKSLTSSLSDVVTNATKLWQGDNGAIDPSTGSTVYQPYNPSATGDLGWCNYPDAATQAYWIAKWSN